MELAPKKWTHRHTQRFFHVSLLAVWLFILAVILFGILFVLKQVNADQITQSFEVGASATVPEISPGPTLTNPVGGPDLFPLFPTTSTPPSEALQYPTVTVNPDTSLGKVATQINPAGKSISLFTFTGNGVRFFGDTNIKNALIFIEIIGPETFRSSAFADGNMHWSWVAPEGLPAGFYSINILAQDPQFSQIQAKASMEFYIQKGTSIPSSPVKIPSSGNIFDVFLNIPSQYKEIIPGQQLEADLTLIPTEVLKSPANVYVEYIITDPAGQVVIDTTEKVVTEGQISLIKTFYTNPETSAGQYILVVKLPAQNPPAVVGATFTMEGRGVIPVVKNIVIDYTVLVQALLVLFLLFSLIAYFEYNKVVILSKKIRRVSEQDLKDEIKTNNIPKPPGSGQTN